MNIVDLLSPHLNSIPNSPAIIDRHFGRDRSITFAQLERLSAAAAKNLLGSGLVPGDVILSLLPVSAELYVLLLAAFRANLIVILPDASAGLKQLKNACNMMTPRAVIYSSGTYFLRQLCHPLRTIEKQFADCGLLPGIAHLKLCPQLFERGGETPVGSEGTKLHERILRSDESHSLLAEIDDTPALLSFTSGSTGQPKAIMRTQKFLAAQCQAVASCTRPRRGTVQLVSLPVFVLANIANGVTSVLPDANLKNPGTIFARPVLRQLHEFRCREILASPAFVERIMEQCKRDQTCLPEVRNIYTGGAPVFGDFIADVGLIFPRASLEVVYGSSEAEPISHQEAGAIEENDFNKMQEGAGLLVGAPVEGVDVAIVSENAQLLRNMTKQSFDNTLQPVGLVGEILVAGEHVVKSYVADSSNSISKVNVDDKVWHRTGDAGFLDERGRLWLLGRSAARIEDEFGVLYPFVLESLARGLPGVQRAAVLKSELGRRTLVIQCARRHKSAIEASLAKLSARFAIEQVLYLDKLPVDARHNSKVDYPNLVRMVSRLNHAVS